jgi:hypothetical protein
MRPFVLMFVLLLVAACVTPIAETPAQRVFALQSEYTALLSLAVKYKELTPCPETTNPVCSEPEVVSKIQRADTAAWAAIQTAQDYVRDPDSKGDAFNRVFSAARALVSNFNSLAEPLRLLIGKEV